MDTHIQEIKRKKYPIVIILCFAAFMASLDSYIVNISLPEIAGFFRVDMNAVSGVVVVFLLFLVGVMLIAGKLADILGLRNFLLWGYLIFVFGSLACGLSESLLMLNISRAIQGIGAAIMTVAPFTIISRYLPPTITGWAFGLLSTFAALGLTLGAPLGGFITGNFSWHWIFLINVPIGLAAAFFTYRVIPNSKPDKGKGLPKRFDFSGSLISFLSIAILTFVLSQGQDMGWGSTKTILLSLAFIFLFTTLIAVEKKSTNPVLDFLLLKNRVFTFSTLSTVFVFIFLSGNFFVLPFYLTSFAGLTTQNSGLVLMVYSVVYMVSGPLAGKASDRIRPEILCAVATLFSGIGCLVFALFLDTESVFPVILIMVWLGIFMGLFISPNNNMVMNSVAPGKRGAASGVFSTLSRLSMILGVVIFEILFSMGTGGDGENMIGAMPRHLMVQGFRIAYFASAIFLFLGFVFCFLIIINKRNKLFNSRKQ